MARPSGTNLQLAAETWEFAQVPWCPWDINLMYLNLTFMNLYCRTGILIVMGKLSASINSARYTDDRADNTGRV